MAAACSLQQLLKRKRETGEQKRRRFFCLRKIRGIKVYEEGERSEGFLNKFEIWRFAKKSTDISFKYIMY